MTHQATSTEPIEYYVGVDDEEESESNVEEEEEDKEAAFIFDGNKYMSYQEMVDAKRQHNADVLVRSGCLEARSALWLVKTVNTR
jgi:hypothetical protein